ncbi:MAG: ABC transporter permease, partial [Rhodospirillaceae bacterium]|nr:ABC transporter permease [Rhodospirillaceae bacterium]
MTFVRPVIIFIGLIALWQIVVVVSGAPHYILPGPLAVVEAWISRPALFLQHGAITLAEILLGLCFGLALGVTSALVMAYFRPAREWLLPVLVISQAVPVFALA